MPREISKEEKERVLSEIGMLTIRQAVKSEGMLVSSQLNTVVNWHIAEVWVKKKSHDYDVPEDVLKAIIIEHLKDRAKEEIDKY